MNSKIDEQLEFDYPQDFIEDEPEVMTTQPVFKASAILYSASIILFLMAILIPTLTIANIPYKERPTTLMEIWEYNPYMKISLLFLLQGVLFFWLGVMVDRRGA